MRKFLAVVTPLTCCRRLMVVTVCIAGFALPGLSYAQEGSKPLSSPQLLAKLPDVCPTPDGLAMDLGGNIIVACPNYADQTHPAVLMKIDRQNRVRLFCRVPVHPETGVACPMGVAFGPDGDLYIVDNQGWVKPNNLGRILRMKIKDGRPGGCSVVASGLSHPNGVRVHKGHIYVTHSMLLKEGDEPLISGVYRFNVNDLGVRVGNALKDKTLLATFKTLNLDVQYGADGLAFDSRGNLFVGNFGDATLHKITFDADGNVASNTRWVKHELIKSIDGICVDRQDNIYVADFSNNAICIVSPDKKVQVLAKSPDCDGSQGGLDQPGEPLIRGREVIVSNFDMVTGPDKLNSGHDFPYTLSVIKLP